MTGLQTLDEVRGDAQRHLEDEIQADLPATAAANQDVHKRALVFPHQSLGHASDLAHAPINSSSPPPLYSDTYPQILTLRGSHVTIRRTVGDVGIDEGLFELDVETHNLDSALQLVAMRNQARNGTVAGVAYHLIREPDEQVKKNFMVTQYRAESRAAFEDLALEYGRMKSMFGHRHFKVICQRRVTARGPPTRQRIFSAVHARQPEVPIQSTWYQHRAGHRTRPIATERVVAGGGHPPQMTSYELEITARLGEQERTQLVAAWILRIWAARAGRMTLRRTGKHFLDKLYVKATPGGQGVLVAQANASEDQSPSQQ